MRECGTIFDRARVDGAGIDVGGAAERKVDAVMCIVDLQKRDSEIKILIGCTHNETKYMKGILIMRKNSRLGDGE